MKIKTFNQFSKKINENFDDIDDYDDDIKKIGIPSNTELFKSRLEDFETVYREHLKLKSNLRNLRGKDFEISNEYEIHNAKEAVLKSKENILDKYGKFPGWWYGTREQHAEYVKKLEDL